MTRMVQCKKLGKELPGLKYPPLKGELGRRIFDEISEDAWKLWLKQSTMLINEYRLNPAEPEAQKTLRGEMEKFFFGDGSAPPPDFVAPKH
jgi:Fe-S cluster biosynthesis and repair protein YggX